MYGNCGNVDGSVHAAKCAIFRRTLRRNFNQSPENGQNQPRDEAALSQWPGHWKDDYFVFGDIDGIIAAMERCIEIEKVQQRWRCRIQCIFPVRKELVRSTKSRYFVWCLLDSFADGHWAGLWCKRIHTISICFPLFLSDFIRAIVRPRPLEHVVWCTSTYRCKCTLYPLRCTAQSCFSGKVFFESIPCTAAKLQTVPSFADLVQYHAVHHRAQTDWEYVAGFFETLSSTEGAIEYISSSDGLCSLKPTLLILETVQKKRRPSKPVDHLYIFYFRHWMYTWLHWKGRTDISIRCGRAST